jgi:hypothetical protein
MDEPGRDLRPGDIGDQVPAPLDGHVLEHNQVHSQGPQARAHGHRRVRHPRRARRHVLAAAAAQSPVQVMLDPPRGRPGDLQLLERAGHSPVLRTGQVRAALACSLWVMIAGLIGFRPAHRRSRRARLLAALAPGRLLGSPPLLARRAAARGIIPRGRHRGITAVAGHGTLKPGDPRPQLRDLRHLRPQARDLRIQRSDLSIPSRAAIATWRRQGQTGHEP